MPTRLATLFRSTVDAVFPPRCIVCARGDGFLCERCVGEMTPADPPTDSGAWRGGQTASSGAAWPVYWYEGAARRAVLALKFRGLWAGGEAMGEHLADLVLREGFSFDAVVPVPLHGRRRRQRGYNQAELLAKPVAAALGQPLRPELLARVRATGHQSLIEDAARRRANVERAFAVPEGAAVAGLRILIIDDVFTTGATLAACGRALDEAGAAAALALTFAHER